MCTYEHQDLIDNDSIFYAGELGLRPPIQIKKNALEAILLSSNIELHKVIQQMSKELGKDSDHKLPITQKDLEDLVKKSPDVIRALALQLHYRLSQRIFH